MTPPVSLIFLHYVVESQNLSSPEWQETTRLLLILISKASSRAYLPEISTWLPRIMQLGLKSIPGNLNAHNKLQHE